MDAAKRIEQFKALCEQDPGNDMARFSLGGAYAQDGRHAEAAEAYLACLEINANFSKAYQLAAESFRRLGRGERAAELATKGYTIAAERGDVLPLLQFLLVDCQFHPQERIMGSLLHSATPEAMLMVL